jgi:phosphodiesterase/alkaline phosphatase D-like protein
MLLLPLTASKPGQPITFSWSAVTTDPSGVTYTLEISQDSTFATTIIPNITGLTTTSYTMTAAEKLASASSKNPYYWRVQAIDLAGNVGAWSTANTFTIGFIWPSWIINVWYGLGIIVALILGLWLGRRMAYQSY